MYVSYNHRKNKDGDQERDNIMCTNRHNATLKKDCRYHAHLAWRHIGEVAAR